jgi:hypothetical protein
MTPLTTPDVRDYTAFAAWSAVNSESLACAKGQEKTAEADIARLQTISDKAYATRDAAQAQCNDLQSQITVLRNDYDGDGATEAFNAILDATPGERSDFADVRARGGQLLAVLTEAVKHHATRRYPLLDLAAQRANCALLSAVADRHVWEACVAGIERHLASAALVSVDGRVSYASQGGRVNELRATASYAMGRYGDAEASLRATEKQMESRGY